VPSPGENCRASLGWTGDGACPYANLGRRGRLCLHELGQPRRLSLRNSLGGFAGAFAFQGLLATDVDLDLLRLGFGLFG
jgi:hypothetical protein